MGLKEIGKKVLIGMVNSPMGPSLQKWARGVSEIIDMSIGRQFRSEMTEKLSIGDIVNKKQQNHSQAKQISYSPQGRIKVRFFHCNAATFNCIQTVCECFKADNRFDLQIVLFGEAYSGMIKQMNDLGYNYIMDYDYDIAKDKPNISVAYHLEIAYPSGLSKIKDYSNFFVLVPLGIGSIWFGERTVRRMNLDFFNADMCFVGNLCYDRLFEPVGAKKIVKMSPPQFDLSYKKLKAEKAYPKGWEKLKGKKTFMLMTDHGLRMYLTSDEVSFDLYFKELIRYFDEHKDCGLILRLHFALIKELLSTYWSINDYKNFVKYCNSSSNIVWDETDDYLNGLSIADASLVDVNCTLVYFVLASNKPIAVPLRYDMPVVVNNPDLLEYYYKIKSKSDLIAFLEEVRTGIDSTKEKRQEAFDKYIETFDGKNGERIFNIIVDKYFADYC